MKKTLSAALASCFIVLATPAFADRPNGQNGTAVSGVILSDRPNGQNGTQTTGVAVKVSNVAVNGSKVVTN